MSIRLVRQFGRKRPRVGSSLAEAAGFEAEPGSGVQAEVEGRSVAVGNIRMMNAHGFSLNGLESEVTRLQSEAKTAMLVAIDGKVEGVIAVADTLKDGSQEAVAELQRMGLKVVMMTGDNQKTAEAIAKQVGMTLRQEVLARSFTRRQIIRSQETPIFSL